MIFVGTCLYRHFRVHKLMHISQGFQVFWNQAILRQKFIVVLAALGVVAVGISSWRSRLSFRICGDRSLHGFMCMRDSLKLVPKI